MMRITVMIEAVSFVLAIAGNVYINTRRRSGYLFWLGSNVIGCGLCAYRGLWVLAAQFAVFFILAIHGWRAWRKETRAESILREATDFEGGIIYHRHKTTFPVPDGNTPKWYADAYDYFNTDLKNS